MQTQRKIMARGDRLRDLPQSILLYILSKLRDRKQVVRTSLLSMGWRFIWMSVPLSLDFKFLATDSEKDILAYLASIHRELYYYKYCQKIRRFSVHNLDYKECYANDVDLWVNFATKLANLEEFSLEVFCINDQRYDFPQFAYKNASLRTFSLSGCQLNPSGSVNWSSLVSLIIGPMKLKDGVMEKVLSGCPNLECLELDNVSGIHRLKIKSMKLRQLFIEDCCNQKHVGFGFEIVAPYIQHLKHSGLCSEIRFEQKNAASLVTAVLHLYFDFEDEERNLEKGFRCFEELLHSVAHVENLTLGTICVELKEWQFPPSSRKFLEFNVASEQLDFPGLCSFLQSSSDLETLVIDWWDEGPRELLSRYTNEDEQIRRFETHNFDCSFPHLKTIKIINFCGSVPPLVKYLLKHATVLEKFVIVTAFGESDVSPNDVKMAQEFLRLPRSSPHASVIFSYR